MPSNLPLAGKTIILTGSKKTQTIVPFIEANGGTAVICPLIHAVEKVSEEDTQWLARAEHYDWLIFTSQNAVSAFLAKLARHGKSALKWSSKIAAVGEKTAEALQNYGFRIDFMPSTYSADRFVQEFDRPGNALFLRGSLAKSTITIGLGADEWTVYETIPNPDAAPNLQQVLQKVSEPIVVFASPSAVHLYAKFIVPSFDWSQIKIAAIGHITAEALAQYDVTPAIQPQTYTMQALIKQLILEESSQ